ncbi:unnamed protein product [Ectocarpus sp. 6 AP-2014]
MGLCSSTTHGVRWEDRWGGPGCKKTLHQFCDHKMKKGQAIVTGTSAPKAGGGPARSSTSSKVLRGVSKDGEFRNWAATVQTAPAKVLKPKSIRDVQEILSQARCRNPMPKIRCVGSGHSWTHLFADDGSWVLDTSGINDIVWSSDCPTQVTIGPGVTPGQLGTYMDSKERGKWRGLFLPSDVVLESVTYGGTISSACHGTGKTQTLPDYVIKMSFIKWDGTQVDLSRAEDPTGFAICVASFGLVGVIVGFTLQLDGDNKAIRVTDSKVRARDLFLGHNELPKPGGPNPLREAWNGGYAVEAFYLAASSLKVTNILSTEFEDQRWDPYDDICAIKTFQRTNRAVKKDNDKFLGYDQKTSTRFDRNFSISDFLKVNLGTEVGLPLVAKFGDKPALVAFYSRTAAKAFEPVGKEIGQVHYEVSLAQAIHWQKYISDGYPTSDTEVCIKCDPDFTSAYKAIHAAIGITKTFAEEEDTLPLNVAMELRITKHSNSPLSPAYGKEGDVFMWLEVLSAAGTPRLKDFTTRVADAWLAIRLKDGSQAAYPHWAKWSDAYVAGADAKIKKAYASRLPYLRNASRQFDPNGVFVNDFFARLFAP